jgi:hypothetical protein
MRGACVLLVIGVSVGVAGANPAAKQVEKVVRAMDIPKSSRDLVLADGEPASYPTDLVGMASHAPIDLEVVVEQVTVHADDASGIAWFQGRARIVQKPHPGYEDLGLDTENEPFRFSGIALKQPGWQIAALSSATLLLDKELIAQANNKHSKNNVIPLGTLPKQPKRKGDAAITAAAAAWFSPGGFGKAASGTGIKMVSGTAPAEHAIGAATAKLVKAWDGLTLHPLSIQGTKLANGKLGVVRAVIALPIPKQKYAAPLVLTAVVVPEGDTWRWVTLHWAFHLHRFRPEELR